MVYTPESYPGYEDEGEVGEDRLMELSDAGEEFGIQSFGFVDVISFGIKPTIKRFEE